MRDKMLQLADRLDDRADAIFTNLYREYRRENRRREREAKEMRVPALPPIRAPKSPMAGALVIMAEEIRELLEPIDYQAPYDFADKFTVKEFASQCGMGFVDSDGSGYYGNANMQSNKPARPSRLAGGDVDERWTHVYWYNK